MPHKETYRNLTRQLTNGLKAANVKVVLNKKVDVELVKSERPDAVLVATGALPIVPDVVGASGPNVVQAVDVVMGKVIPGSKVVIIGGRLVGMEIAIYLAGKGKEVCLVTQNRLGENGKKLDRRIYRTLRDMLIRQGVQILAGTLALEIRPDGVFANDGGDILWLPTDTVVLACGYRSETALFDKLRGLVPQIHKVGDCKKPRDGLAATREGFEVGFRVG
jgi:pyruvate/2-oxoglutarate dehydrogenase complex dihydrolipoamide dehydrogenase (E3) component